MIRVILDFCIRERLIILLGSAAVVAYGWYSTQQVPQGLTPYDVLWLTLCTQ